jgi:dihydrolipoamide dehydrogenase
VTGAALFTHLANYQARVAVDNIMGRTRRAIYRGVPRGVFSDPEIAAVGLTDAQALESGHDVATAVVRLPEAIARPWTYERDRRGELGLLADRRSRVLLGAWGGRSVGGRVGSTRPRSRSGPSSPSTLLDGVAQLPTYSEALLAGLEQLTVTLPGTGR